MHCIAGPGAVLASSSIESHLADCHLCDTLTINLVLGGAERENSYPYVEIISCMIKKYC